MFIIRDHFTNQFEDNLNTSDQWYLLSGHDLTALAAVQHAMSQGQ
jgi:hypothetical protein